MLIQRWAPDSGLRSELSPYLEPFLSNVWPPANPTWQRLPPTRIQEQAGEVVLSVGLPGVDPDHIRLHVLEDVLELSIEVPEGQGEEGARQPFKQAIRLPCAVDAERATAEARHGMLRVSLPKPVAASPRSIPVRVG